MGVTEEYDKSQTAGKNFKELDQKLQVKEKMMLGSQVYILSGPHASLYGKIVAAPQSTKSFIDSEKTQVLEDGDAYLTVELENNESLINIKRKRLILRSEKVKEKTKKSKSRSRSRS